MRGKIDRWGYAREQREPLWKWHREGAPRRSIAKRLGKNLGSTICRFATHWGGRQVARFKVLGSVAHNFGHSFTSLMNYRADDYVMGHLVARSFETRAPELRIDVLSGHASPPELLTAPISDAVRDYCQWFPKLVASHRSSLEFVRRTEMSVTFDLSSAWQNKVDGSVHAPYVCRVLIEDSRGRPWTAELRGSWYSELPSKNLAPSKWIAAQQAFALLVDRLRGRTHPPGSASATAVPDRTRRTE